MRFLLVEVAGEPYALPLARLARTLQVARGEIQTLEGREHVPFEGQRVGVVSAAQIFGKTAVASGPELSVVILGERAKRYGVVVDRFLGERQLVVQPLDPRLGKIKDISAGALMPDGSPVLILNVDDLMRSVELLVSGGRLDRVQTAEVTLEGQARKRVLVVDDSLTVRELERKLIGNAGYEVEVAIDGMDGWNAVRTQPFDLVVTDIDMPRLDGIELVRLIKNDLRLKTIPVMIVSYKDRPEDRNRGLEAGADYYLTKGSFHDETLLNSVADLIGTPFATG
jgi:two-component system sensor histidine kinase and response regulator WspE